ncbi:MAG: ATP-binding cassette domain-containing protein [Verrucomicrobiota bacterium]
MIQVRDLTKVYRTYRKQSGFWGSIKGLVHRKYDQTEAVHRISFDIEEGELVGFMGPNGAGKTTTLKMLSGLLYPSSGSASVLGHVPWERHDDYRRRFALLLGQKNQLWWDLPARESLALNAKIYGISDEQWRKTVGEMSDMLDVTDKLDIMVRELSLGERMKMELIASLLHQPQVLFLDEPTIGLDVISQKTVRDFLKHLNKTKGTTIILTSHYMADIQELCRRVMIIDHGKLFYDGDLQGILDQFVDEKRINILIENPPETLPEAYQNIGQIESYTDGKLQIRVKRKEVIQASKSLLDMLPIADLNIEEVPIEEVIRQIYSNNEEK